MEYSDVTRLISALEAWKILRLSFPHAGVVGLRQAEQKALQSSNQDSQLEKSLGDQDEAEVIWPGGAATGYALSTTSSFTVHGGSIEFDPLSLEGALFNIDQGAVGPFDRDASDMLISGTPGLGALSSDSPEMSPSSWGLASSILHNTNYPREKQTSSGLHAIHIASKKGFASIVHVLLKNGANPNLADSRGRTAMHYAVEGNHYESVKVLFHWGADPLAEDLSGQNSLYLAVSKGYYGMVCLLMDHGVNPNLALADDVECQEVFFAGTL
ncbi:uncharacterized protein GIQ15_04615 [Arthroderma uncinatum]|uniref:uncharacterized protein n=1 Tax=Arthroderma uncinatum TaxID=74035 RepID=UPI00144A9533|nr:uncharacterized protein GIQ15_04615 [Arthroderma uncinatum]KAF3481856.1 hypothetical protein GIQ15_04615 [Arthroderma uncinatum]